MSAGDASGVPWFLVSVVSGDSSTLRVFAWRTLRRLGAVYLQSSVCLLPATDATVAPLERLGARLRDQGGAAQILRIVITDRDEEQRLVTRFSAEREDEYREVCSRVPDFLREIEHERARSRATYTEFEESEVDLRRLRRWLEKIRTRDYFGAPGRAEAEAALDECARALASFEAEAFAREQTPSTPGQGEATGDR